jgi:acyl-coenzyme A thioesterase PaaI-like protein
MNLKKAGIHSDCIMCGEGNLLGLKLKFKLEADGSSSSCFRGGSRFQGYNGILHGGIISAILDSAMTNCLFLHGIEALTGKLEVRFLKPIPCDGTLKISAGIISSRPPFHKLKAHIKCGEIEMAEAEAKFMETGKCGFSVDRANV